MSDQVPGRRASALSRRRVDILVALAIVLPSVVALSVALIGREEVTPDALNGPETAALTDATVVCPQAVDRRDAGTVRVTRTPGVRGGELAARTARAGAGELGDPAKVDVAEGSSAVVPSSAGVTALDGTGAAAPGIVAGRGDRLAVPECRAPSYDEWLVGIGASARYATTLELVNPDDGEAVVDLALYGATGPVEEPVLHGIQVPPHGVKRIVLATEAPQRQSTAAHLTVNRGRVTASVLNTWDPLGRGRVVSDYLPADLAPSTQSLILGLPADPVGPTLFLANPGDDEVRTTIRLVTDDATFTPAGSDDIAVAPQSMKTVNLSALLKGKAADGVVGLVVQSTGPVASSLRMLSKGDLALLAPVPLLRDPTAAVLPPGPKTLVLGGAVRSGTVHVEAFDASGKSLAQERIEVAADRAATLALPPKAVTITVEARNTGIGGVVTIPATGRSPGLATLRLRAAETRSRIPDVEPR
ncbi:MAG TPA: DUF5719 family protein [Nocardioides sp.]|nr:DUF5719 family protein [Nocardioides sp.]